MRDAIRTFSIAFFLTAGFWGQASAGVIDISPVVSGAGINSDRSTIVIKRLSDAQVWTSNTKRAQQRFSPASTSKIAHTLIALENGQADQDTIFRWDGVPRSSARWNRDQTLASAFEHSAVWVFRQIARDAGSKMMAEGLASFGYGNASVGTADQLTTYWLDDTLRISAVEQIDFLTNLAQQRLPLSSTTYTAAREIMTSDRTAKWTLRSKTGWRHSKGRMDIGWFVGWLECKDEIHVFALNLDMPDTRYLAKRRSVTLSALRAIGAFDCG